MSDSDRSREEGGGFKVIDRRRFSADGRERNAEEEESSSSKSEEQGRPQESPPRAAPPPPTPERTAPPPPSTPPPSAPFPSTGAGAEAHEAHLGTLEGEPHGHEHGTALEPSFSTLVLSLSTQALMYLGEIPEGPEQPTQRDLEAARSIIDILGVLQQKTAGNLDANEAQLLERILYDLRMRFVELARQ